MMTDRLAELMNQLPENVDAALITCGVNRRYYTGFPSSAGTVLASRAQNWLIVDSRYFEAAGEAAKNCSVILQEKLYEQIDGLLRDHGLKTLAIESEQVTLDQFQLLQTKLPSAQLLSDNSLSQTIQRQRSVKNAEELDCISRAQEISDRTFSHILTRIEPGRTEREIALEMEFFSRENGSEQAAFSFIVVSGPNSSLPHGVPGDRMVERGDFIVMDFGSTVNGYRSDMTRTVAVGSVSERQRQVYDTVLRAQLQAMELIRPGARCSEVDAAARNWIDEADNGAYKGYFGHSLGHSLGLDIHEDPRFTTNTEAILKAGMVMSVEPGIYLPGEFGVRIEDIVAVTESGYRNFVSSTKELLIL